MYFFIIFLVCMAIMFLYDTIRCAKYQKECMTPERIKAFLPIAVECGYITEKEAVKIKEEIEN